VGFVIVGVVNLLPDEVCRLALFYASDTQAYKRGFPARKKVVRRLFFSMRSVRE
jgi:hypothetical protein